MADKAGLIELTTDLIRIRSTHSRPEGIRACADFIATFFDGTGLTVERHERNGIPSVVITKGTKTPAVFFSGHFDVVEAEEIQFTPSVDGDRLYGRGALDMKSGIAAMMTVMKDAAKTPHDVGLMLTGDEEIGGFDGTAHLTELGYLPRVAVIPDGGEAIHNIIQKEKGILRIELSAKGISAHASLPWQGDNAIRKLADAVLRLESAFKPIAEHPDDHWVTTCSVGKIEGGDSVNSVPSTARAWCDVRFTETDPAERILSRVREILPEDIGVSSELLEPYVHVDMEHPLVRAFADSVRTIGREPVPTLDHGSTDGRFFAKRGIPVIISQPDGANLHAANEWVSMDAIDQYARVLRVFLDKAALAPYSIGAYAP